MAKQLEEENQLFKGRTMVEKTCGENLPYIYSNQDSMVLEKATQLMGPMQGHLGGSLG